MNRRISIAPIAGALLFALNGAGHGGGRNTMIAASAPSQPARTATNNRSSSGANNAVRAPEAVAMRDSNA
jgi:hypothetical protein